MIIISCKIVNKTLMMISHNTTFHTKKQGTYLLMHSQIVKSKFPARERFANAIVNAFKGAEVKIKVEHWACCLEPHKKGNEHFHTCL